MKNIIIASLLFISSFGFSQMVITTTTATSGTITGNTSQQDQIMVHDAGVTLTLTVAFPSNPKDAQNFVIASTGGITTLTLSSVVGTISNAISSLAGGGNATYIYSLTLNKWIKIR